MPNPAAGAALVGGQVAGALADASAARRQNRILAQGQRQQSRAGMEATGVLGDFLTQLRASAPNPAGERAAFSAATGPASFSTPPGASGRFQSDVGSTAAATQGYGSQMADLFARIRAPALQRQNEGEMYGRATDALRPIQMRAGNDAYLTNLRAAQQQANPWAKLLGGGFASLGQYMLSKPAKPSMAPGWYNGRLPSEVT